MKIISHRGGTPENTKQAFQESLQSPHVDGIECDVQFTKDHTPIIFHDENLLRLFHIDQDVGSVFYEEIADFGIMTLTDFLILCQRSHKTLMIEIKRIRHHEDERMLKQCLEQHRDQSILIASFDETFLTSWTLTPRIFLCSNCFYDIPWSTGFEYIGLSSDIVTKHYLDRIRRNQHLVKIFIFTVNDVATLHSLLDLYVDGIITDSPSYIAKGIQDYEQHVK